MSTNTATNYPLVYREEPHLRLSIVYNPFDLSNIVVEELIFDQDKTLADYLEGLPSEVAWLVGYNGRAIEPDEWASIKPSPFSTLSLVRVPEGGKSGKSILRIVAMLAVAFAAFYFGGALGAALVPSAASPALASAIVATTQAALMVAGSMLVNAVLPPTSNQQKSDNSSTTYGIDGAKNTAKEGVVIPRVYGEFRIGGNIVDCYTLNVGDDQYLYMRTVLNDGEVESIDQIEINQQPIASFKEVETRVRLGKDVEEPNDWFDEAIRLSNRGVKITTDWTSHKTESQVDRLRVDVLFPGGLYTVDSKGGKHTNNLTFDIQYRQVTQTGAPLSGWQTFPLQSSGQPNFYVIDQKTSAKRITFEGMRVGRGYYEVQIRRTTPEVENNERDISAAYLADIGEIDISNVNLNGIANVGLRIKLDDQLNGIPTMTALVKGSKVNVYDDDGHVTEYRWSNNPADVVADILTNPITGAGYSSSRLVWSKISDFRDYCSTNSFAFNGVFDTVQTLWDSVQAVAKVGHGTLVPRGTKLAVAIDGPASPVMVFGPGNIKADSFKKSWLSLTDRANEVQLTFQDKTDGFKQKTVRRSDAAALARGDRVKPANIQGFGITNIDQAVAEADYTARQNVYIKETVSFDAPLEAIGLNIGDVALIQHDTTNFANGASGRLKGGSTQTVVNLDRAVTMTPGQRYSFLVLHSAILRANVRIQAISGNRLTIANLADGNLPNVARLVQGGIDTEIIRFSRGTGVCYVTVDDASGLVGGAAELWDTDAIEEADVVVVSGETETITLSTPLTVAPAQYANFMFGQKENVKKPFRLRRIKGTDVDHRSLEWVQYDSRCYEPGDYSSIVISTPTPRTLEQVSFLVASYEQAPKPDQERIPVTLSWVRPRVMSYGGADIYVSKGNDKWEFVASVQNVNTYQRDFSRGENLLLKVVAFDDLGNRAGFDTAPSTSLMLDIVDITLSPPTAPVYEVPYWRVDATAKVTWGPPVDGDPATYRVEYKSVSQADYDQFVAASEPNGYPASVYDPTGYAIAATTPLPHADIPRLDLGCYFVRVRSQRGFAASPWVYLGVYIGPPGLPERVTGLKLSGVADPLSTTFFGKDAKFVWNDVADSATGLDGEQGADVNGMDFYWRDYLVRVLTPEGAPIREETTREANYVYTLEKNIDDCRNVAGVHARRAFTLEVYIRGRQGQMSQPARMTVSNPAPSIPALLSNYGGIDTVFLTLDRPLDNDAVGTVVWASETTGFAPTDTNRVFYDSGPVFFHCDPRKRLYFRYAAYDAFGLDQLNISSEFQADTTGITSGMTDSSFWDGAIPADVMARIQLVDGDGPGSVNARIAGVTSEINNTTDRLSSRIDTLTATAGSRIFFQTAPPTAGAINDVWINPDDKNRVKRWDGTSWVYTDDARIASLTADVSNLQQARTDDNAATATQISSVKSIALARNKTYRQATAPIGTAAEPLAIGDLWYATQNNNQCFRWNGAAWQDTSDARISSTASLVQNEITTRSSETAALGQQINTVSAVANAKNQVFKQSTQPLNPVAGDVWIDTTNGLNTLKRYNGTQWEDSTDGRVAANAAAIVRLDQADAAESTARAQAIVTVTSQVQAKSKTFFQATAPVSDAAYTLSVGDIWYNSADNNRQYRWNGSVWVEVTDVRTSLNTADISDIKKTYTDPNGAISQRFTSVEATAASKNKTFFQATAPASPVVGDLWVNSANNNITSRWNGSTWQEITDTRLVSNTAYITNLESAKADGTTSLAETIRTHTSSIGGLNTTVTQHTSTINGIKAQWGVYIDNNGVWSGLGILSELVGGNVRSQIKMRASQLIFYDDSNNGVVPFSVSGGVVYAPNLVAGNVYANSITTDKLVVGGVDTSRIALNAVSNTVATTGNHNGNYGNPGGGADVCSVSVYCNGGALLISGMYSATMNSGPGNINATANLYRDGYYLVDAGAYAPRSYRYSLPFYYVDSPGIGWHTYTIRDVVGAGANIQFFAYGLSATELKR